MQLSAVAIIFIFIHHKWQNKKENKKASA